MAADMLRVDIFKRYGDFTLDIAFESAVGALGLFGPSGAGKTTLLSLIAGLVPPDRGTITLDDIVLDNVGTTAHMPAHRRRIGYVFQDARLFPHLGVRGNLDYGRRMNRLAVDPARFERVAAMLDIGALMERRVAELSGGEKQRVALGRALLAQPRLLLLDEPLASLDRGRKDDILPYLERLRDEGIPLVYVSHDARELRRLVSEVVVLARGRVTASGGVDILEQSLTQ